jgi:hypothetical protein
MAERIAELAAVADAAADRAVAPPVALIRRRARRRSLRQAGFGVAGVLVLATAGVFAFQQHPQTPPVAGTSPSPSPSPASSPTPTLAVVEVPPSGGASSPSPAITHCRADQLSVSARGAGAASLHTGLILVFRNTGTVGCRMTGYPGVALLNAQNVQVVQAQRSTSGYLGGAPVTTVTLAPGGAASALLEVVVVDDAGNTCAQYPRLLVTAPDDTTSVRVDESLPGCSVQIHPVVSGTSGRSS